MPSFLNFFFSYILNITIINCNKDIKIQKLNVIFTLKKFNENSVFYLKLCYDIVNNIYTKGRIFK